MRAALGPADAAGRRRIGGGSALGSLALASTALCFGSVAHAQSAVPGEVAQGTGPEAKAGSNVVEAITVTGAPRGSSSIDRRSYSVAKDLFATTGTISDVLKNIPGVEVDFQGNVSIRGETNITVMIDGKASNQFSGPNGAQALQALSAESIERIEVITNPSADLSPEGVGGIINLISKRPLKTARLGQVGLNVGTGERANASLRTTYNHEAVAVTASVGVRTEPQNSAVEEQITSLDGHGVGLRSTETQKANRARYEQWNGNLSVDYDLGPDTRISGNARFTDYDLSGHVDQTLEAGAPRNPPDLGRFILTTTAQDRRNDAVQAALRHRFAGGSEVTAGALNEVTREARAQSFRQTEFASTSPGPLTELRTRGRLAGEDYKLDYVHPFAPSAKLKLGYVLHIDDNNYGLDERITDRATASVSPSDTDAYAFRQTVQSVYATYEYTRDPWTILGGVRLEDVRLQLWSGAPATRHRTDYSHAYPSIHVSYSIDTKSQVVFSLSERIKRPTPQDLNPHRVRWDALNFNEGNPALRPQLTYAFELGYTYKSAEVSFALTAFHRRDRNGVTDVFTSLGDGVTLDRKENLARSTSTGLELATGGQLTPDLSYTASSILNWTEIVTPVQPAAGLIDFPSRRAALLIGGRGSLNWRLTPMDLFQFNGQVNAKRSRPQGHTDPSVLFSMGYRHRFDDAVSAVVTVQDALHTYKIRDYVDTPLLHDRFAGRPEARSVIVGLTWNFGGNAKRGGDSEFEFGAVNAP